MSRKVFKLNDEFIVQLTRVLQLSMMTGTNIVDHMRQIRVEEKDETGSVVMTPEYLQYFDDNIKKMMEEVERLSAADAEVSDASSN